MMKKVFLYCLAFTFFSLATSWIAATMAGINATESYPGSIFAAYAKENKDMQSLEIKDSFPAAGLEELTIKTHSVDLVVEKSESTEIEIELRGRFPRKPIVQEYRRSAGQAVLETFEHDKENKFVFSMSQFSDSHATLVVRLPNILKKLHIDSTHGDIQLNSQNLRLVKVSNSSSDILLEDSRIEELELSTASGDLQGSNVFIDRMKTKSVSGDIQLELLTKSPTLRLESASGDISLELGKDIDAEILYSSSSGDFELAPEFGISDGSASTSANQNRVQLGKGRGRIEVITQSGDLEVNLAQ